MQKYYLIIYLLVLGLTFTACEDYLEPELDNVLEEEDLLSDPSLAEGVLLKAYSTMTSDIFNNLNLEVASDNATTNNINSNFLQIATGGWQADNNPTGTWNGAYSNIQYINQFIRNIENVQWDFESESLNRLHQYRLRGEAHGLRAWYQFQLLQAHAGVGTNGELLGYPISTQVLTIQDDLFLARNTFQECIDQIIADCNIAIENIAASYEAFTAGTTLSGRIEAEDYDAGGPGVGYNDTSEGNNGNQYKEEDVDIEVSQAGGFNVGWTADGEWLNYSFDRAVEGTYDITLSLASNAGNIGQVKVLIGPNSNSLTELATFQAEQTGWQGWTEYTVSGVKISGITNPVVRIEFVGGAVNFDYFVFEKTDGPIQDVGIFKEMEFLITELDLAQGARWRNRFTGNAARALKSKVELLAASPAFANGSTVSWDQAAQTAGQFLADAGGLSALAPDGLTFYKSSENADIIWNRSQTQKLNWEQANFPPSLFGRGETNPSQNLVDAFPMINGMPITDPNSGYDPNNPYLDRDPRLFEYIIVNGSIFKNAIINTFEGAPQDGINISVQSTRTGYYLRKYMDESVNLATGAQVSTQHNLTYLRFTEIFLNYAEAANEAYGPDADPNNFGFTARDILAAIRERAGIAQPDEYLASVTSQEDFRALVRNERRLELCFEGLRFWDIRRWNDQATLTETINGTFISPEGTMFEIREVEPRIYQDYMIYGPIPFNEIQKYDIIQNQGW